ncbi:MAG: hypothetical protein QGG50_07655 [Methanopyri archaeon]|nr:hypothetical protein [Methanopyri archaeon]
MTLLDHVAIGLFFLDLVLDGLTTKIVFVLGRGSLEEDESGLLHLERNPFARGLMGLVGVDRMLVASRVLGAVAAVMLVSLDGATFLLGLAAAYAIVPVWNLTVILHYLDEPEYLKTRVPVGVHIRWCLQCASGR